MTDADISQKLSWVVRLLAANLLVMAAATGTLLFGLLPKVERGIQTTERVEARFQAFADEVQPVLGATADKAIETVKKMDAEKLSKTATDKTNALLDTAAERTKRFLNRDITDDQE